MKPGVVYLLCCLTMYILPIVSGQMDACDNMFSTLSRGARSQARGRGRGGRSGRRKGLLLNIAHGNPRTEQCPFIRSAMASSGGGHCMSRLRLTCPVPTRRATPATRGSPATRGPPATRGSPARRGPPARRGSPARRGPPARRGSPARRGPPARRGSPATRGPPATRGSPAISGSPAVNGIEIASLDVSVVPNDCPTSVPVCNSTSIYRTMDGSCNNIDNPHWGQAGRQQKRLLPNAYDDGRGSPRTKACNGGILPDARTVSNRMHVSESLEFEKYRSLLLMQLGQFLVHDLVLTKVFTRDDGTPLECCGIDRNKENCNPIKVPAKDTHFKPGSCLDFPRSNAVIGCSSVREPKNSQSSWFDLSTVYGTSIEEARALRAEMGGGKLKHVKSKLPVDFTDSTCVLSEPFDAVSSYCPMAGDGRVAEQAGLASMHTLFMREHNRLAEGLAIVNPHWDGERLYQEARKINIGQWQHIMYTEYLPTVLGRSVIQRFNLQVARQGFNNGVYDPAVDGTISNAAAVAALRYGHSQVHDHLGMLNSTNHLITQPLEHHFFETLWYHANNGTGLEDILNWITKTGCPFTDRKIQNSIRQNLFLDVEGQSLDLAALNIHRGRDHGIPGYNAYRKLCGLSNVVNFGIGQGGLVDHDFTTASLLQEIYSCPDDIDLFTGMMSEKRTNDGSLLGPTWQCLLASEFRRLRNGDRFFYERSDPYTPEIGFTEAQLNSIKRIRISTIICLNTEKASMQLYGLYKPNGGWNQLLDCARFRGVDINIWREITPTPLYPTPMGYGRRGTGI